MLHDYDRLVVGGTPVDHDGLVQWTTDSFGHNVDDLDLSTLAIDWTITADAGMWTLLHGDEDDDRLVSVEPDYVQFHADGQFTGSLEEVDIGDDTIQLSGFDDATRVAVHRTSTDSDQIMFIDRHGSNDYDLLVQQGGTESRVHTTADDDIDAASLGGVGADDYVLQGDVYPAVADDGVEVTGNAPTLDFTNDLAASWDDTEESVTVEFVGSTIPAEVYEDSTLEVSDANGLDFLEDFIVTAGTDNRAEVELDLPDDLASKSTDETVTGAWTFDQTVTATVTDAQNAATAATADDADALGGAARSAFAEVDADETVSGAWTFGQGITTNGGLDATGDITEAGDRVATRPWVGDQNFATDGDAQPPETHGDTAHSVDYADVAGTETVTGTWTVSTDTELVFGDGDDFRLRHSATAGDLVVDAMADGADSAIRVHGDGTLGPIDADSLAVEGTTVATEPYVDSSVFSGSYTDLSGVPSEFTPETHGNDAHSSTFATETYVDNQVDPLNTTQITSSEDFHVWFPNTETEFWLHDGGDVEADGAFVGSYIDTENGGQFGGGVTVDGNLDVNGGIEVDDPITTTSGYYAVMGEEQISVQINGTDGNGILNIKTE